MNTQYMPPTQSKPRPQMTGLSVTALVLGCVALALSPIPILNNAGAICGVLAIIMGLIAAARARRWMPVFGILLGVTGFIITLALQAQWARELDDIKDQFDRDMQQLEQIEQNSTDYFACWDSYGDDTARAMIYCGEKP